MLSNDLYQGEVNVDISNPTMVLNLSELIGNLSYLLSKLIIKIG